MKGSVEDMITVGMIFLVTAILLVFIGFIWQPLYAKLMAGPIGSGQSGEAVAKANEAFSLFDKALVFVQIVLLISLLVSVFYIDTNPAFFFISLIFLSISIFISAIYSDIWSKFISFTPINQTVQSLFPLTNFIFGNYVAIITIAFFAFLILLYAKGGGERV